MKDLKVQEIQYRTPVIRSGIQRWLLLEAYRLGIVPQVVGSFKRRVMAKFHPDGMPEGESTFQILSVALDEILDDPELVTDFHAQEVEQARQGEVLTLRANLRNLREHLGEAEERASRRIEELEELLVSEKMARSQELSKMEDLFRMRIERIGELHKTFYSLLKHGYAMPSRKSLYGHIGKIPRKTKSSEYLDMIIKDSEKGGMTTKDQLKTMSIWADIYEREFVAGSAPGGIEKPSTSQYHATLVGATAKMSPWKFRKFSWEEETSEEREARNKRGEKRGKAYLPAEAPESSVGYSFLGSLPPQAIWLIAQNNQTDFSTIAGYMKSQADKASIHSMLAPYLMGGIMRGCPVVMKKQSKRGNLALFMPVDIGLSKQYLGMGNYDNQEPIIVR